MPCSLSVARTAATPPSILYGLVRDVPRMVPAPGQNAATLLDVERASQVLGQAPPVVTESDEAVAMLDFAFAHDGPDDGIKPRAVVATAGQHADSHHHSLQRASCCAD